MSELPESLRRFYAEIAPLLFGEVEVDVVEQRLGPSRSGSDNLDFYRILLARNIDRILRDLFLTVHTLVAREHPGLWPELVRDYARTHPAQVRDPNRFGLEFSEFLASRRAQDGLSPVLEELADLHMCRYLAAVAQDEHEHEHGDDGFEQRVFLRGYTHPVVNFARVLARNGDAPIPAPRPTTVIIYRSLHAPRPVRTHEPSLAELGALARRQQLALTGPLASLQPEQLDAALAKLIEQGVLGGPAR